MGLSSKSEKVWILIPVETKAREFDAKLLLSCVAAEAGFGVILGNKNRIEQNMPFFPRGVVIANNIVRDKIALFRRYRALGYRVAAWCEEGVAYRNRETYRHERVCAEAVAQLDVFFAWGAYHAEDVRRASRPADADKIIATGSPRFDVLRPEFRAVYRREADERRAKHGRMILVNTNFHRFNHYLGRGAYLEDLRSRGTLQTREDEEFARRWIAYLGELFGHFSTMIREVAGAFPDHKVVVRPHPSEDHEAWRRELEGIPNAEVIHEGSAIPWILASEVLIHNSCATGCEAYALGVPVLAYRPVTSDLFDSYLPNAVSRPAFGIPDLLSAIRNAQQPDESSTLQRERAIRNYSGLEGPLASENMIRALRDIPVSARPFAATPLHAAWGALGRRSWPPVRALLRRLLKGPNRLDPYLQQKFPGLALSEVTDMVARFSEVSGRFSNIEVRPIGEYLFRITSRE